MAFDLTKLNTAFSALTDWVKAGLNKKADATATTNALASKADQSSLDTTNQNLSNLTTTVGTKADATTTNTAIAAKQNQVLVGTTVPSNATGNDGDVAFVVTS